MQARWDILELHIDHAGRRATTGLDDLDGDVRGGAGFDVHGDLARDDHVRGPTEAIDPDGAGGDRNEKPPAPSVST